MEYNTYIDDWRDEMLPSCILQWLLNMGWGMEQKQLYENHYKDCAVSSHM